jgi:hypothetical protein
MIDKLSVLVVFPGSGDGCCTRSSNDCAGLMGEAWAAWAWRFGRLWEACRCWVVVAAAVAEEEVGAKNDARVVGTAVSCLAPVVAGFQ